LILAYTGFDGIRCSSGALKSAQDEKELHQKIIEHLIACIKRDIRNHDNRGEVDQQLIVDREQACTYLRLKIFLDLKTHAYNMEKRLETLERYDQM